VPKISIATFAIVIALITADAVADAISTVLPLLKTTAMQGREQSWSHFPPQGGAPQAAAAANVSQVEME
jgi:hypothetical protein